MNSSMHSELSTGVSLGFMVTDSKSQASPKIHSNLVSCKLRRIASRTDVVGTSLTRIAVRRLQHISENELSSEVRAKAALCLLDTLGAIQTGLSHDIAESMAKFAAQDNGRMEAYAFSCKKLVSAETAAFTNAALAHYCIRDDMHLGSVAHLGSMVIPAAIALAQKDKWSDEQLLRAIVGGYEMGALLGTAIQPSGQCNPHLRASGLVGAFAVTAAALCALHPINEDVAVSALSLAVNRAFVKETSSTLTRLTMCEVVDRSGVPTDGYNSIRQAHGNDRFKLEMRDCFGSSKWSGFM